MALVVWILKTKIRNSLEKENNLNEPQHEAKVKAPTTKPPHFRGERRHKGTWFHPGLLGHGCYLVGAPSQFFSPQKEPETAYARGRGGGVFAGVPLCVLI